MALELFERDYIILIRIFIQWQVGSKGNKYMMFS